MICVKSFGESQQCNSAFEVPDRDLHYIRLALQLAERAYGETSPNPLVGAVLVKQNKIIGQGWHHRAGKPHAEIEALNDAARRGHNPKGATLYVTLEPCCTHGRTPPCTDAIINAGIKRVVVAAGDPNPAHAGRGLNILKKAGIELLAGIEAERAEQLNESFNHWIVHRTPFVTLKAAMTLDGKIATAAGESKWITGEQARGYGMRLRQGADVILVGINTVLADDPQLTVRREDGPPEKMLRRFVLDPRARTPLTAKVICDQFAKTTTIVVTKAAEQKRIDALRNKVAVLVAPMRRAKIDLRWLMAKLGEENVTNLLVEGGGETNALFLQQNMAHRVAFFYAPKIVGGRDARKGIAGDGIRHIEEACRLGDVEWQTLGDDLLMTARIVSPA